MSEQDETRYGVPADDASGDVPTAPGAEGAQAVPEGTGTAGGDPLEGARAGAGDAPEAQATEEGLPDATPVERRPGG